MKKRTSIVIGLLALSSANVCTTHAQPTEAVPVSSAPDEAQLKVQRAEANAQIMVFATETMRSQLTPKEFALWPSALRDALPYWLEFQPFEAWSPELQGFATGKFRALADDPKVEPYASAAPNKAAVGRWLQEKAPFENAQLRFFAGVRVEEKAKNQDGALVFTTNQWAELPVRDPRSPSRNTRQIVALGRLIGSLSPDQKAELFANKMRLPFARLSQQQKQTFDEFTGPNEPTTGGLTASQFPKTEIAIDFQFSAIVLRVVAGKEEEFDVQIARPFDYLAR